ncbi:MAG: hypothetical protein K0Q55_2861 [Verrucomicrobia bacterium]|jgi:exosortase|nr:hypothetical protein [Verrucomicrobiota bacterium]
MNAILRQSWPGLAALAAVWLWTWVHLAIEWRMNPQYEYGFAVPLLAALLWWSRVSALSGTPVASPADERQGRLLCCLALLPLFAGEFVRQADPFWRISGWLLHVGAMLMTFGFALAWGGRSWLRVLLVPVFFLTLAVPWPSMIEGRLTNGLLAVATRIAVDCLNWLGIPSLQRGNVIELSNGMVGIDEACSGIQSLLSSLMAAVFLGAYLKLTYWRRLILVLAGVATAVVGNVVRIIVLTKAVQQQGQAGFEKAHDPVGMWASAGIFVTLGLLAWLMRPRQASTPTPEKIPWPQIPPKHAKVLLVLVVVLPFATGLLWRAVAGTDRDVLDKPHWQVRATPPPPGWAVQADTFSEAELRLLQFSEGGAWSFKNELNIGVYIVHMFWSAERTIPSQAFGHSAQICLPSAGWKSLGNPAALQLTVGTNQIAGTLGYFEQDGNRQAVFQATWRGTSLKPAATQLTIDRWSRLRLLKEAYRQRGHETLTVYLPAALAAKNPELAFSSFLNLALVPNTNNPAKTAR